MNKALIFWFFFIKKKGNFSRIITLVATKSLHLYTMALNNKFLSSITSAFTVELKEHETMDGYLDEILPMIKPWSEDLREEEFYLDTRWLEIKDTDDFLESLLHIFRPENEYLLSIDGNISKGIWRRLDKSNTFIIELKTDDTVVKSELYDLAYLSKDFFILKKHGDQLRKGKRKYFVLVRESKAKKLEWREIMDMLFNTYQNNSQFLFFMAVIVIIILTVLLFSLM